MTEKASKSENRPERNQTGGDAAERDPERAPNFVRDIVSKDVAAKKNQGRVATRFPPEPNGYLHIGHAKSICLNFGLAAEFDGTCNLRFDDTNPVKEDVEYVESIQQDIRWLGFDWDDRLYYASDYFQKLYDHAVQLIKLGKAYVCSLTPEQTREYRGAFGVPGKNSPFRDRSVEENLDLFARMRAGEFDEGAHVLRAKIDMASPNMNMRDPPIFRIRKAEHHRTGDKWCIYPMYDFAHCLSDAAEGITHSVCTLEFEDNRPLYDWFLDQLQTECHPQQIEFAPLNLTYTVLSKRNLKKLVDQGQVSGWNDPRMPTLSGLRRRGYPPEALKDFADRIGVSKRPGVVELSLLEYVLREHLNAICPRVMAVLNPLRLVIDNYPEGESESFEVPNHPEDPGRGTRRVPFSRVLYVEREDFRKDPPKKWHRLAPGREVRLRYACLVRFERAVKNAQTGEIEELHCTWDPESRGGNAPDGRKVRGTLHWVSAEHAFEAQVRLYDRLFTVEDPLDERHGDDFSRTLNHCSLTVLDGCKLEPGLAGAEAGARYQFERMGYFCVDPVDSAEGRPVFNRIIGLRDSWSKLEKTGKTG